MRRILPAIAMVALLFACEKKEDPVVTSISIDKSELTLKVGDEYQFKASHIDPNAPAPEYTWEVAKTYPLWSPNPVEIAKIDQSGKLKALKEGETVVSVIALQVRNEEGITLRSECKIKIEPVKAGGIKLNKNVLTLDAGGIEKLTFVITPENTTYKDVSWTSKNSNVATVVNGEVKAVGPGETKIAVTIKNTSIEDICTIKVNPAKLEGLNFSEKEKTIMQGESYRITPVFTPEYASNKNITWSTSDKTIATVDKNGNVNAVHFGQCTIKAIAEDGGFEATCVLTIKPIPVESIMFEDSYFSVEIGGKKQLKVKFFPENAGNRNIKWSSSNPIVVPIDENGIIRGNTQGSATITAVSEDGGHTASLDVYVVPINQMMDIYFPSSSVVIINGFYTGTISCAIRNSSSQSVKLKKFSVWDTNTYRIVAETTDESLLGSELAPGQTIALSGRFNSVYEPAFEWELEYNGRTFTTYNRYGDRTFSTTALKSIGKEEVLVPLRRSLINGEK